MEEDKIDQTEAETEVSTQESESTVEESKTEESVKDVLGKQLGKEFASDADALAAVEGLKNLVGDQKVAEDRKDAKKLKELEKDPQYASLRAELETVKLNQKHPEANDYLDEIKAIADAKGISYNAAFENSKFGALVAQNQAKEQVKKDTIDAIPGTDPKVSSTTDDEWEAATKAANEGNMESLIRLKLPNVFKEQ